MEQKETLFNPEEMQSPFDAIKEVDGEGREWWNSRKLARLLGYQKYWNFERLMDKAAAFLQQEKGLDLSEHMMETTEMAQLGVGTMSICPMLFEKFEFRRTIATTRAF